MKKMIYIATVLLMSATVVSAQNLWSVQYNIGLPHGESADFTENASFRGITVDGKSFINENFALGGFFGWNVFTDEVIDGGISFGGTDIFGHEYRYLNAAPLMATASYYPTMKENSIFNPYVGLGIGTIFQENVVELGTNTFTADGWMFGLSPEVGINIFLNEKMDFMASYRFVYGFETHDVDQLSYSTVNFGLSFKL